VVEKFFNFGWWEPLASPFNPVRYFPARLSQTLRCVLALWRSLALANANPRRAARAARNDVAADKHFRDVTTARCFIACLQLNAALGLDVSLRRMIMLYIGTEEPLAVAVVKAIRTGDLPELKRLLVENPGLAKARLADDDPGGSRALLHVATDWPGHFPRGAETVAALVAAGAEVDARFTGSHSETPLHWAASSNDIAVLDALIDAGADIDAPGAVIGGGTPLADATAFGQWEAARRLVERGSRATLWEAGTLGLMDRVEQYLSGAVPPTAAEVSDAFWGACHGGQKRAAEYLLARGADPNWIPEWASLTPLDAARRSGADELFRWLRGEGGKRAEELD
jgi:uncharacterized protein